MKYYVDGINDFVKALEEVRIELFEHMYHTCDIVKWSDIQRIEDELISRRIETMFSDYNEVGKLGECDVKNS